MENSVKKDRPVVDTELSLHPKQENVVSDFQKEFIEDEIKDLPPIKEGDINVSAAYIYDIGDKYELSIYIRNGLTKPINLEKVPFDIVNSKDEVLASQIFDLKEMGKIPAHSVRPWKIYFDKENVNVDEIPQDDWKIVFDSRIKAIRYVKVQLEDLPEDIAEDKREMLQQYVNDLPKLKDGDFSISTFYVKEEEDGSLGVTLIMRNGTNKAVELGKLPVTIYDAEGKLATKGVFENINVQINPYKATVREFVFLKEQRLPGDFNFEKWTVKFEV
ncbi:SLAP domain-containing protein [Haloimpatiens sp. FM7330]|uniref:SLAP domain-containing protein n=1 Tax=Haloimpatiens sp. FM7330 TaxID=3298610 RepID=UPI00363F2605